MVVSLFVKNNDAGEWNGLSRVAHTHQIAGSTPVLQQFRHISDNGWFRVVK